MSNIWFGFGKDEPQPDPEADFEAAHAEFARRANEAMPFLQFELEDELSTLNRYADHPEFSEKSGIVSRNIIKSILADTIGAQYGIDGDGYLMMAAREAAGFGMSEEAVEDLRSALVARLHEIGQEED